MNRLLDQIAASDGALPFALLRRHGGDEVELLTGDVVDVAELAGIPLDGRRVLAAVPFRQVRERGFAAHDDGAPLRCLIVGESERMPLAELLSALTALAPEPAPVEPRGFDVPDAEYAAIVRRVIAEEIGRGEGANFVIARSFLGHTDAAPVPALLSWFRALLEDESGAYWTFAVHLPAPGAGGGAAPAPGRSLRSAAGASRNDARAPLSMVGATPERHLSVRDGVALMNPISGTYRHPETGPTRAGVLDFLADVKESEELFMVVDEEMKMMSAVCPAGGRILGPYLKQMSRLSHTEYLLEGHTSLDVREALRLTMFAPTVTGSPMQNACAVIARHEPRGRGHYAGVLALFEPRPARDGEDPAGGRARDAERAAPARADYALDAPILIRTAYLGADGRVSVPAGATLVRHSTPEGEVAETRAKASGVLAALGLLPRRASVAAIELNAQPGVAEALAARNERLASFWRLAQNGGDPVGRRAPDADRAVLDRYTARAGRSPLAGRSALVIDNEDQFTTMLAHQLRHLGLEVHVAHWTQVESVDAEELVVFGPGPGDPRDLSERRIARLRALMLERVRARRPLLAVCLSHQVLAQLAGFELAPLPEPRQGVRLEVDVFGERAAIGFYNTFAAREPRRAERPFETRASRAPHGGAVPRSLRSASTARLETTRAEVRLEASVDPEGVVTALRGPGIASIQGHLESVLSSDGYATLRRLVEHCFGESQDALRAGDLLAGERVDLHGQLR